MAVATLKDARLYRKIADVIMIYVISFLYCKYQKDSAVLCMFTLDKFKQMRGAFICKGTSTPSRQNTSLVYFD